MSQLRQVLVHASFKYNDNPYTEYRLVTVNPFQYQLPENLFELVKQKDDEGNNRTAQDILKDHEENVKAYMDKNADEINRQIKIEEDAQVRKSVMEYYGDNFIDCVVLETIGLAKTLGVVK